MDKKRAAIVATAGVGLLVSALVLHQWRRVHRTAAEPQSSDSESRAVVEVDGSGHDQHLESPARD